MILAVVFLLGVLVGALLVASVLAVLERDSGAKGYIDLTFRGDASSAVQAFERAEKRMREFKP